VTVYYQRIVSKFKVKAADTVRLPQRRENINSQPTPAPVFEDRSTSIRLNVEWPRALRAFKKNPLLGTGYSSITLATDNDFLRLLGEIGILGFLSFILIFSSIFNLARKMISKLFKLNGVEKAFVVSFVGGLIGILLNAIFIDIFIIIGSLAWFFILYYLIRLTLSLFLLIKHEYLGHEFKIYQESARYFWSYLLLQILFWLTLALWFLVFFIPALIFLVFYILTFFVFFFEGKRGLSAIKHSQRFV